MAELRSCPQCGAVVELPAERIADRCAFCETPLVVTDAAAAAFDAVAPFELTRAVATNRLTHHLQGQFWAPQAVRQLTDPEKLNGVLLPFWVYDGVARARYSATIGLWWYRTETYTVQENGKTVTRTRQVRETEWFPVTGTHAASYSGQLVSGSRGLPEAEANALEPFDLGKGLPFDPLLVAGWIAEQPSIASQMAQATARTEISRLEEEAVRRFLPGDEVAGVHTDTDITVRSVRLVLLPVWIATYRFRDQVFRLLVNGQTGEVVGQVPKSAVKIGIAIAVAVVVLLIFVAIVALTGGDR